jgi:hypothetical protein
MPVATIVAAIVTMEGQQNRDKNADIYFSFTILSLEAVCFFRLLLSFDNASSCLAANNCAADCQRLAAHVPPYSVPFHPDRTKSLDPFGR